MRLTLTEKVKSAYRKFDKGEIMFVAEGGRRITLKGWRTYLDASNKNQTSGFVPVSDIVELNRKGELPDDVIIHVTVFRPEFSETVSKVKYSDLSKVHVADSRPIPEAFR